MQKLALLTLTALLLASCNAGIDQANEPIKVGYIGPLTGDAAGLGADLLNGTRMRIDEINAQGGIGDRMIELIAEDGRCTGSDSAGAVQKLINIDGVIAIVGGQCSGETLAAAPIAETAEVILMSPVSSSPDVTVAGDFVFRNYPSDDLKGKAFSNIFEMNEWKKIAFITENTDFCQGIVRSIEKYLAEDAEIVFNETVDPGTKDFRTLITRLQDVDFDVFIVNVQSDTVGSAMLSQLRELGITQAALGTDTTDSMSLFELAEGALENFSVISIPAFDESSSFAQNYKNKYGEPNWGISFSAHAYDATSVVIQAVASAGTKGVSIRDYLYAMAPYSGEIGAFSFDENGDVVGVPFALKKFVDGEIVETERISVD